MGRPLQQWAIRSWHGFLHYGTWRTRREAIAAHVWAFDTVCYRNGYPTGSAWNPLNEDQRRAWQARRKRGDRAVKVNVVEIGDTQ